MRPWLLLPKVIAVACWTGGLAAATWLAWALPAATAAGSTNTLAHDVLRIESLFRGLLTPALLTAGMLGLLLTLQHPRVLIRMRWWQIKVALAAMLPVMWWFLDRSFAAVRMSPADATTELAALRGQLVVTLGLTVTIILLGRHKPRCGQNLAKASPSSR